LHVIFRGNTKKDARRCEGFDAEYWQTAIDTDSNTHLTVGVERAAHARAPCVATSRAGAQSMLASRHSGAKTIRAVLNYGHPLVDVPCK
jgi:hypothetical protein